MLSNISDLSSVDEMRSNLINPHDDVVEEATVDGLGEGVPGVAGLVGLERNHDDGPLEPALVRLHHSSRKCTPHVI